MGCRNIPRSICAESEIKSLTPVCNPTSRDVCTMSPVHNCKKVPKQYCYQVSRKVKKEECESYPAPQPAYPQPSGGYSAPKPSYPEPSYPEPSYPEPSYPKPSYPEPSYSAPTP